MQERPGRGEQPAPELAPDREADVVAQDRRRGGDRDDGLDASCPRLATMPAVISAVSPGTGMPIVSIAMSRKTIGQADVLGDVQEGREGRITHRFYHARGARPDHHRPRPRLAGPRGHPAHRPRRRPHAGLRPAGDQGDRQGDAARRGRRPRLRHRARATPSTSSSIPATSASRASAACTSSWAGAGRSSPTRAASRSSRWATARSPTRSRAARRTAASARAGSSPSRRRRALPLLPRRLGALHGARDLDGDPGRAGLRPRARLRRVHAAQRAARLHGALDRAHAPLAATAAWTGTTSTAPTASSSTASCRAASIEDLRVESAQAIAASECDGIAIGGSLGADKAEMHEVVDWTTAALPRGPPAPPAGHRRDRRPRARRRAGHRHLRLRDAHAPGPPRHGARARPRAAAGASTSARRAGRTPTSR